MISEKNLREIAEGRCGLRVGPLLQNWFFLVERLMIGGFELEIDMVSRMVFPDLGGSSRASTYGTSTYGTGCSEFTGTHRLRSNASVPSH